MSGEELKPCPFCGTVPSVYPKRPEIEGDGFGHVRCENDDCPAQPCVNAYTSGPDTLEAHKAAAIALWNRRSAPRPAPAAEGERWEAEGYYWIVKPSPDPATPSARVAVFDYRSERDRAVSCQNACIGIDDPEKAVASARDALRVLARKEIPAKPQGNAGAYSIRHSEIMAARTALASLGGEG